MMWSLVPLRKKRPLNESVSISLFENVEIGRRQLLEATANACGCCSGMCPSCQPAMTWGVTNISKRALRLSFENQTLQVRGKNTRDLLRVDETRVQNMMAANDNHENDDSWTTVPIPIQNGTVLTFALEKLPEATLEFQIVYTEQELDETSSAIDDLENKEAPREQDRRSAAESVNEEQARESFMQQESIMEKKSSLKRAAAHVTAVSEVAPLSQSARHSSGEALCIPTVQIQETLSQQEEETVNHLQVNDAEQGNDMEMVDESLYRIHKQPQQHHGSSSDTCHSTIDTNATLDTDAQDGRLLQEKSSLGVTGASHTALDDDNNDSTRSDVPDESILHTDRPIAESSTSIQEQASPMSATCTQDLLDKISCDIDACEQHWQSANDSDDKMKENHEALSRHQTQDTTMVSTRVGAQIVSGDEALAPQEINRTSDDGGRQEQAIAATAMPVASSGPAFESTNDTTPEGPATKKQRSSDVRFPTSSDSLRQTWNESGPTIEHSLNRSKDNANTDTTRAEHSARQFKVMFVKLGNSCSSLVLPFKEKQAKAKGAIVVDSLEENPTHLLIDSAVEAEKLAEKLHFGKRGIPKLIKYLEDHDIETVKLEWLEGPDRLENPKMNQLWTGLAFHRNKAGLKRKLALPSKPKPGSSTRVLHSFPTNDAISLMFHKLAKMHQECALKENDEFRALTNNLISGRVKFLDFEITPENLDRVKKIKGIGESSAGKMKQFFDRGDGSCNRIEAFEKDKERMAVRVMQNIWGVGIKGAQQLMRLGYETIDQIRNDLDAGILEQKFPLNENQKTGIKYYEDFLERMTREEVEEIAGIVKEAVRERFPKANVTIMGSYRRGKETCGDIDLLITDPNYLKTTPLGALGELVSRLKERGHISFHLTPHLQGMNNATAESQSSYDGSHHPVPLPQDSGKDDGKPSSSSYMGVFCSPAVPGKMRRIDIKLYPYQERVFASIYFVGNGWFNRSIRRWASRMNFSLDDHGLFPVARNQRAGPKIKSSVFYPNTEREVFDRLGLVYKEPTDRNYFDDVIPLDESVKDWDPHSMTESELMRDAKAHSGTWVD